MLNFIKNVLGESGFKGVEPLLKNDDLTSYILPKVVIEYLKLKDIGIVKFDLFNSLNKSELGYSGNITLQNLDYSFNNVNETQVAAIITVALNKTIDCNVKALDLAKLSKTLELLLKNTKYPKRLEVESKNTVAPKQAPIPPDGTVVNTTKSKLPRRNLTKTLIVSKKESTRLCKVCKTEQFKDDKFVGCTCLKGISKSVECLKKSDSFILKFNDTDLLLTVAEALGR